MSYCKKISSLEEMALCQVAINLCQENDFKEVAMCLEKPTYDLVLRKSLEVLFLPFSDNQTKVQKWDVAFEEQCQRLMEGLPNSLKQGIRVWINRIALEYLSYSKRQEILFGMTRYFLMDILTTEDWTEIGELNEKKLAMRLLTDERLSILQRYRIACVYCLHENIPHLWNRLSPEEKQSISGNEDPRNSQEKNTLVLLWSYYMDGRRDEKVAGQKNYAWTYAALEAVNCGNQAALMQCWKRLDENARKHIVMKGALHSLEKWRSIKIRNKLAEHLVLNEYHERFGSVEHFNLPSYYRKLLGYFLSEMSEIEQLEFFETAFKAWKMHFEIGSGISILECFLEWPLQDYLLPTLNRLWGITPKDEYGRCLSSLAEKYRGAYDKNLSALFYKKQNHDYDYQNLLWKLWEETPEEYKQFCCKRQGRRHSKDTIISYLLLQLLKKTPFLESDKEIFKRVLRHIPQTQRAEVINSKSGENMCFTLLMEENWSFLNWLLEQCLSSAEIPSFKKQFIESYHHFCCVNLALNTFFDYAEDYYISRVFELAEDKIQFKHEVTNKDNVLKFFTSYLVKEEFTKVESVIDYFLSTEEMKAQFKEKIVKQACEYLLKICAWGQMDKCLAWGFDAKQSIKDFKKDLFCRDGFDIHYKLVFIKRDWKNVEVLYKWFCLSHEEIIKFKKETIFAPKAIKDVHKALYGNTDALASSLCFCLTDEEMVISFKEKVEKQYFNEENLQKRVKNAKQCLEHLVNKLLYDFRKPAVHDKATTEGTTSCLPSSFLSQN